MTSRMRSRSRTSAMTPSTRVSLDSERRVFENVVQRRLGALDDQEIGWRRTPPRGRRSREPIEPPPPVTSTRLPRMKRSEPRAGRSATVGRSSRSSISSGASSASRMPSPRLVTPRQRQAEPARAGDAACRDWLPAPARSGSRRAAGSAMPRSWNSCTTCSRSAKVPSTGTPRIDWPRSSARGTTECLAAGSSSPCRISMARSTTSTSAGAAEQQGRRVARRAPGCSASGRIS